MKTALAALSLAFFGVSLGAAADLPGASPGERAAIQAFCGDEHSSMAKSLCMSNQLTMVLRLGRKPDLSVASSAQRQSISQACSGKRAPGDRFACERAQLASAGLPVHNEAGGGALHMELATAPGGGGAANLFRPQQPVALPFFSLQKWRVERPAMPPARNTETLSPVALNEKVAPSVYVVMASEHAIELTTARTEHSQGSAVAVTDHILLTNCHVIAGRPQISVSQDSAWSRARLIYGDPAGDRCFLEVDGMVLHPVQGVRRVNDLRVGETVYSVGTPAGLERSFGEGLVAGVRDWEGVRIIQNSAPSWFGSSGGGLFDGRGNLVGITTAISSIVPNTNFSIAADDFWP